MTDTDAQFLTDTVLPLRREILELRANIRVRDEMIVKLNDALEMADSVIRNADATIKELQRAVTQIEQARA